MSPGTGRSSKSALRPRSPASTAAICWSRVAGSAPRRLGKGATEDCEWRDGPIGSQGSEKQASLARSRLVRPHPLWEERCSDDKNVAEWPKSCSSQANANCRRRGWSDLQAPGRLSSGIRQATLASCPGRPCEPVRQTPDTVCHMVAIDFGFGILHLTPSSSCPRINKQNGLCKSNPASQS